jgi:hypothetical protein
MASGSRVLTAVVLVRTILTFRRNRAQIALVQKCSGRHSNRSLLFLNEYCGQEKNPSQLTVGARIVQEFIKIVELSEARRLLSAGSFRMNPVLASGFCSFIMRNGGTGCEQ